MPSSEGLDRLIVERLNIWTGGRLDRWEQIVQQIEGRRIEQIAVVAV